MKIISENLKLARQKTPDNLLQLKRYKFYQLQKQKSKEFEKRTFVIDPTYPLKILWDLIIALILIFLTIYYPL
jgi:hypothetical protein